MGLELELELTDTDHYMTSNGPKPLELRKSVIEVKGSEPETLSTRCIMWGPVWKTYDGSLQALRWTAYNPEATNAN